MLAAFVESAVLMLVLFNPFLMSIYLLDIIKELEYRVFARVLVRAFIISGLVFFVFAWAGDAIFSKVLQVRFAAFLIFGGLIFLLIALRFILTGAGMITALRGPAEHLAGSIAMPFMIGPGTISASVLAGARLPVLLAMAAILVALTVSCALLLLMKLLHDHLKKRNAALVDRYVDVVGRVSALVIGTIAMEMIFRGIDLWLAERG